MTGVEYDADGWPVVPAPSEPVTRKPAWFDEVVATHCEMTRERWYLPDGTPRAYANAPAAHRPKPPTAREGT